MTDGITIETSNGVENCAGSRLQSFTFNQNTGDDAQQTLSAPSVVNGKYGTPLFAGLDEVEVCRQANSSKNITGFESFLAHLARVAVPNCLIGF